MAGDHGALTAIQRRVEHSVEIRGEQVEGISAAAGHTAAAVTAVIERYDPVILGQVGDLVPPDLQRAGDAVRQHDRVAVVRAEDLGMQTRAVGGTNAHLAPGRYQTQPRTRPAGCRRQLTYSHDPPSCGDTVGVPQVHAGHLPCVRPGSNNRK